MRRVDSYQSVPDAEIIISPDVRFESDPKMGDPDQDVKPLNA